MSKYLEIEVQGLHTNEMLKAEVRSMLGAGELNLTLGMLESLWVIGSPYVSLEATTVEPEDVERAYELIPHGEMSAIEFHEALTKALDTAWRAFEIIVPDPLEKQTGRTSEIEIFSPEWFADTISQACHAMPSLTYRQILWEIPLALTLHLAVSTARRNGMITERPKGIEDALKEFRLQRNKHNE